jgi:hypothetical protein
MSKLFYAQQDDLGYPISGTMMSTPLASIPKNTFAILPQDYTAGTFQLEKRHAGGLRYFIRKKADGSIIPNSLFINTKQPTGLVYELKVFYNIPGIASVSNISGAGLNYTAGSGPSAGVTKAVTFYHISSTVTFSLTSSYFELSADGTNWVNTGSVTMNATGTDPFTKTIYIRAKAGLSTNTYTGTLTVSSPNATSVTATVTSTIA